MSIDNSRFRTALMLVAILSISACASTLKSNVNVAADAEFDELKTFAWLTDQPMIGSDTASPDLVNPLYEAPIRASVESELTAKGYRRVSKDQADFVVALSLGAQKVVRVQQYYADFGYRYYGFYRGFSRFGRFSRFSRFNRFGPAYGTRTALRTSTEGTLVVDIFENTGKQAIWHGSATKRLSGSNATQDLIAEAVTTLLAEFPDRDAMAEAMNSVAT